MDASDLTVTLQNILRGGGRPHMSFGHGPCLLGPVQDEKQQLDGRLAGGEVSACPNRPAQLGVQRFDGIRNRYKQ
jgi:hypothetical protein